jgi:hypothetical protein
MVRIDGPLESCGTIADCNRAVLLSFDPAANQLQFDRVVAFPSGCNKFAVRHDPISGRFFALTNPVTLVSGNPNRCGQRNQLVLASSDDLVTWSSCRVVAWDDTGLDVLGSIVHTGLQYVDWRFDNGSIVALIRAGYNGSTTYHDANQLLLTRIDDYVDVCYNSTRATGTGFSIGILQEGQQAWNNRDYVWRGVPLALQGLSHARKGGGTTASVHITAPRAATVYAGVCADDAGHNAGPFSDWTMTNLSFSYSDMHDSKVTVLSRNLLPGHTLAVPSDQTWCGTVVFY